MEEKCKIGFRQFTARFMASLEKQRQAVIFAVQSKSTSDFINLMLQGKQYAYEYAKEMSLNGGFNRIFNSLRRKLNKDISQSEFQNVIKKAAQDLDAKFAYDETLLIDRSLHVSNIPSKPIQDEYRERKDYQSEMMNLGVFRKDKGEFKQYENGVYSQNNNENIRQQSNYTCERPYDRSHENQCNATVIPKKKIQQKEKQHQKSIQKSSLLKSRLHSIPRPNQKIIEIEKSQSILNEPEIQQRSNRTLSSNELKVEVRYLQTGVQYESYEYNGFSLKQSLQKYIRKFLSENEVIVRRKVSEIKIMEELTFVKSKEAGNYRFNPFCDVVQIWLKLKNNTNFDFDFTINGDMNELEIISKTIPYQEWNKTFMTLTPKSTIEELVKYVCQKRQATQQCASTLTQGLKRFGGANIVEDLFGWERSDYSSLKVKPTYIFEIQQAIEQIKDSSNLISERSFDEQRKKCIKIATSHKILRYIVYKSEGQSEVKKIAWLNMKNLIKAVQIVRKEIHNKELLDQLEDYFNQFALDPDGKPLSFSRGMILYGPPGTGKTVLTEALPNIIGFHLIEKGLSAADFMKSLVGETSRMIKDLVNRASISPYLLCSIGIDEVDGLVPDRKDKDEKNKGEGISIMLSVIGGNKDVPNLTFMTSTNYIKKIDEAIGRRLSGKFQVGRPNPMQRGSIIMQRVDYLRNKPKLLEHLIQITTNFTGAALGGLGNSLLKSLKIKKKNDKPQQLNLDEITDAAIVIARQFKITLGIDTLPAIYHEQADKKFIFSETFFEHISNHFLLIKHLENNEFGVAYAKQIQRYEKGRMKPFYQKQEDRVNIQVRNEDGFNSLCEHVKNTFKDNKYVIKCFTSSEHKSFRQYFQAINKYLCNPLKKKTVIVIQDHPYSPLQIKFEAKLFERSHHNLYIIFYILPPLDLKNASNTLFQSNYDLSLADYTGRILVELNEESRMAFQLKNYNQDESKVAFRLFLKSQQNSSIKMIIPQLVEFFTKQEVSYLLLLDYELLLQNDAFEEKKILQVMEQKMLEAKTYQKSAVIIDVDSLILLNQNASDSNFGRSMSYSIQNHTLFQILLNYMRNFSSTVGGNSRWMCMIANHPELVNILKKNLNWPKYPQEIKRQEEQKILDNEKRCFRCGVMYTQRQNKEERKCMQHPGYIIDTVLKAIEHRQVYQLKVMKYKRKREDKTDQNRFIYACCQKGLDEQGENAYYHITEDKVNKNEDDLAHDKQSNKDLWNKVLKYIQVL